MKSSFPFKISMVYLVTGLIWIFGSDALASALFAAASGKNNFQTVKGIFFVFTTAILLYFLIRRFYAQQQLKVDQFRESDLRYQFLFQESPLAKIIYDAQTGLIVEVNERAAAFFGYRKSDMLGASVSAILRLSSGKSDVTELKGVMSYISPCGSVLRLEMTAHPFLYNGAHNVLLVFNDVTAREEALSSLTEHRRKLMAAQKIAKIGYWESFDGLYWSDEVYEIWGLDKEAFELSYENFLKTIYPEDRHFFLTDDSDIDTNELEYEIEHRFLRPDGTIRWARQRGVLTRPDKETPFRGGGTVQDITEVKHLSLMLDKAGRMAMIGAWEWNLNEEYVQWSDVTKEIHGVPEDFKPTLQEAISFYLQGHSRQLISRCVDVALNRGEGWDVEAQIVTPSGTVKWVRSQGEAEIVDGKCIRLYGSFQDIDRLKRSELAIIDALKEQVLTLERIRDGYISVDRNWTITYWNNSAERILGRSRDSSLGKALWDLYPDAIDSEFYRHFNAVMETGISASFEAFYEKIPAWFELDVFPSGQGIAIFFKDITERINYVHTIERKNQTLREIAWSQSHEVRSPLARMLTLISLLDEMSLQVDPEHKELLDMITASAYDLDDIIRKITARANPE